ncbi:MAG TPA: EF-P lysine aminoacylase GenX, partial [Oceanospirillales bacterium]|nr:EF-P lysine aminoacylase GenX [Oceanospirillales bacterium]
QIRQFMHKRAILEVETPILTSAGNTDVNIESFCSSAIKKNTKLSYLRTSAEFPMKRLLCQGVGDIYEIGKVFRKGEFSSSHNHEFTMLEWYRVGFDYQQLMQEVAEFLRQIFADFGKKIEQQTVISFKQCFKTYLQLDLDNTNTSSTQELNKLCQKFNYDGSELKHDEALDYLFATQIQPKFAKNTLTFVTHYPASQAALAKINPHDKSTALRFEVFYQGFELGNGYEELTDAHELQQRFEQDNQHRMQNQQTTITLDTSLLNAMAKGMPDCSGIAIGLDRLLMLLCDCEHISQVLTYNAENA